MKHNLKALAVDIGSSSVKAAVVSVVGEVLATSSAGIDRSSSFPEMWLKAIRNALATVISSADLSSKRNDLDSIIISGAGPTLVAIDNCGKAIACLMWNDPLPAATDGHEFPKEAARSIFFPRIAAMPKVFPGIEKKAARVFSGPEFAVFSLCGGECTVLPEARYSSAYWDSSLVEVAGFKADAFPPFCEPGFCAGVFRQNASPYSHIFSGLLPEGLAVRAAPPDFVAALIGTGAIVPGRACDRAGTSEGLNICTFKPIYAEGLRTLPSPAPNLWNISCLFEDTGKELSHLRSIAPEYAHLSYEEIFAQIAKSPIITQKGQAANPARELTEKICLKVKGGIEKLEAATSVQSEFVLSGGQAKSSAWNQMKADITGAVFLLTQTENAELLGDAIIAFCAADEYASYNEACRTMIRIQRRFEPNAKNASLYREKYSIQ